MVVYLPEQFLRSVDYNLFYSELYIDEPSLKKIENNVFYITCLGFYFIIKKRKYKHHFKLSIYFDHYQITKYREHDSRSLFVLRLKETELGFCFFLEPYQIKGTFPIQIHIHLYFFRTFQKILKVLLQQITSNSYM